MPNTCWVQGCASNSQKQFISMFRPPSHPTLFSLWDDALKGKTRDILRANVRICEKHFHPEQVIKTKNMIDEFGNMITHKLHRSQLAATAIPSLFPTYLQGPPLTIKKEKKKDDAEEKFLIESITSYHNKLARRPHIKSKLSTATTSPTIKKKLKILFKPKAATKSKAKKSPINSLNGRQNSVVTNEKGVPVIRIERALEQKKVKKDSISEKKSHATEKPSASKSVAEDAVIPRKKLKPMNSKDVAEPKSSNEKMPSISNELVPQILNKQKPQVTISHYNPKNYTTPNKKEMILCVKISVKKPNKKVSDVETSPAKSFEIDNSKMDTTEGNTNSADIDNELPELREDPSVTLDNTSEVQNPNNITTFLNTEIKLPDKTWAQNIINEKFFFTKFMLSPNYKRAFIEKQIILDNKGGVNIFILDKKINSDFGNIKTSSGLGQLLKNIHDLKVCVGVPQPQENIVQNVCVYQDPTNTWRHTNCSVLASSGICEHCKKIIEENI